MEQCCLEDKIDHSDFQELFRKALFFCPLRKKQSSSTIVCGVCCIRTQEWLEARQYACADGTITNKDIEKDPDCWIHKLPDRLLPYHEELKKYGYHKVNKECTACHGRPVHPPKSRADKPTDMRRYSSERWW